MHTANAVNARTTHRMQGFVAVGTIIPVKKPRTSGATSETLWAILRPNSLHLWTTNSRFFPRDLNQRTGLVLATRPEPFYHEETQNILEKPQGIHMLE